jgi:hypothetical protein
MKHDELIDTASPNYVVNEEDMKGSCPLMILEEVPKVLVLNSFSLRLDLFFISYSCINICLVGNSF